MVSPVKSKATMAKDNQNGFLSSILAWVRNGTIGERDFPGFTLYNATQDEDMLDGLSEGCKTALTGIISVTTTLHASASSDTEARWKARI
jgi:hypothetical protein